MAGTHVKIAAADGGAFDSYVAAPAAATGVGVVIVSTISGVDSDMTHYAETLAAEGFVASAPDMFWRDADPGPLPWTAEGRKRAFARNERHDIEQGMKDLSDVISHLRKHTRCNGKIARHGILFRQPFRPPGRGALWHGCRYIFSWITRRGLPRRGRPRALPAVLSLWRPGRRRAHGCDRAHPGSLQRPSGRESIRVSGRWPWIHDHDARPGRLHGIGGSHRLGAGAGGLKNA